MPEIKIVGVISPKGYLHIKYGTQNVDGKLYTPYDIVIFPNEKTGEVLFQLPQGIEATIEFWSEKNGFKEREITVTIPKPDSVALADLK